MTVKNFIKELSGKGVEGEIIKTVLVSLIVSFATLALIYFVRLDSIPGFFEDYGFFLFFSIISYAVILPSLRQVRSFKEFPCMSGMMIGMTIGMISGFLPGYFVGATNGMFWGSVFGMTIGITLGVWNGKCCGIMGVMEGTMAGFMGGLMGAMTAVMMYNDNLLAGGVITFLISAFIMSCLNYMVFKETRGAERNHADSDLFIAVVSFLLTIATIWIMVFGPRSPLFA